MDVVRRTASARAHPRRPRRAVRDPRRGRAPPRANAGGRVAHQHEALVVPRRRRSPAARAPPSRRGRRRERGAVQALALGRRVHRDLRTAAAMHGEIAPEACVGGRGRDALDGRARKARDHLLPVRRRTAADRRCRSLSCRGDGRGAGMTSRFMISRRIIALLAMTRALLRLPPSRCRPAALSQQPRPPHRPRPTPSPRTQGGERQCETTREGDEALGRRHDNPGQGGQGSGRARRRPTTCRTALRGRGRRRIPLAPPAPERPLRKLERAGTGQFTAAEFELPQRPARGSAGKLETDDQDLARARTCASPTCPAATPTGNCACPASIFTRRHSRARDGTCASQCQGRADTLHAGDLVPRRRRPQVRVPVPVIRQLRQERLRDRRPRLLQPRA